MLVSSYVFLIDKGIVYRLVLNNLKEKIRNEIENHENCECFAAQRFYCIWYICIYLLFNKIFYGDKMHAYISMNSMQSKCA